MKRLRRAFTSYEHFIEESATFIMCLGALGFVSLLGFMPFEQASSALIGSVAVTGGLSSLCFSLATLEIPEHDRAAARYAAEKLLHGSIMAVQAIIVKFGGAQMLKLSVVASTPWIRFTDTVITAVIAGGIGAFAMYACFYGIERINGVLWRRFRERRDKTLGWGSETEQKPTRAD